MMIKSLVAHFTFYSTSRIVTALLSFSVLVLYTHLLSPEEYGIYTLIYTAISIAYAVLFNWIALSLERFYFSYPQSSILNLTLKLYGICIVVSFTLSIPLYFFLPLSKIEFFLGVSILAFQAFYQLSLSLFKIRLLSKHYSFLSLLQYLLNLGIGTILVWHGLKSMGALIGFLLSLFFVSIFCLKAWDLPKKNISKEKTPFYKKLLEYGLPLGLSTSLQMFFSGCDRYFIAAMRDTKSAGIYSANYDLATQSLGMLTSICLTTLCPLIFNAYEKEGKEKALKLIQLGRKIFIVILLPATLGMIILSKNIIYVIFGPQFSANADKLITWISLGFFISSFKSFYLDIIWQLAKYNKAQVYSTLAAAICNSILNLFWVPSYGMLGSAYATAFSYACSFIVCFLLIYQRFELHFDFKFKVLFKLLIPSIIMSMMLLYIRNFCGEWALFFQISSAICLYFGSLYFLYYKEFKQNLKLFRKNR